MGNIVAIYGEMKKDQRHRSRHAAAHENKVSRDTR
jgi:hypothetical protein